VRQRFIVSARKQQRKIHLHKPPGREGDNRSNHLSSASPFSGSPPLHTQRSCRLRRRATNCWFNLLVRGCKRTFSPFHRGIVTTYALEVGAAGDGDYRDHSFSAFWATRSIHGILPIFHPNQQLELLFRSERAPVGEGVGRVMLVTGKPRTFRTLASRAVNFSLTASHRLANVKPLQLRGDPIQRLVVPARLCAAGKASIWPVARFPKPQEKHEGCDPQLWAFEKVKLYKARHLVEMTVT
jgi:hypothetical protein